MNGEKNVSFWVNLVLQVKNQRKTSALGQQRPKQRTHPENNQRIHEQHGFLRPSEAHLTRDPITQKEKRHLTRTREENLPTLEGDRYERNHEITQKEVR